MSSSSSNNTDNDSSVDPPLLQGAAQDDHDDDGQARAAVQSSDAVHVAVDVNEGADDGAAADDGPLDAAALLERLRAGHARRHLQSFEASMSYRKEQIKQVRAMIETYRDAFEQALYDDLRKPKMEADLTEIDIVLHEIEHTLLHMDEWAAPETVTTNLMNLPGSSTVRREPMGVILNVSPWNYPFQLSMLPLIGAIAAGNAAVLKPSELSPATSKLLASLLPQYLDPDCYAVVEGAIPESTALLAQPFDLVFFTGSTVVGRIVMRAAAEHLTPVVLELGGKSPTYVDETARLDVAVRRITFGRFSNCGQTCVAPDYILVKRDVEEAFLEEMQRCLRNFFGDNPRESDSFGRVISARHWRRLVDLISADGLDIVTGGPDTADEADLYIPPTIIRNCDPNAAVMQEEIFGPILPVIVVDSQEEAEKFIRERPKPLAAYMFSSDSARIEQFLFRTYAGMTSVNDVGVNALNQHLPFGGVGASGIGGYHGKYSFDVFSHKRAVLWRSDAGILDVPQRYPPYTESKATFLRRIGAIQHCVEWCSAKTYVKLLLALFVLGLIALILFLVGIF